MNTFFRIGTRCGVIQIENVINRTVHIFFPRNGAKPLRYCLCVICACTRLAQGTPRLARRNQNKFNTNLNKFDLSLICSRFVLISARQGTQFPARERSHVNKMLVRKTGKNIRIPVRRNADANLVNSYNSPTAKNADASLKIFFAP